MDLDKIRKDIDHIDRQLVDLFCQRMALSAQVAAYKKENGMAIYVPEREQSILEAVAQQAGPEMEAYVQKLYASLFALSRDYQAEVIK